MLVKILLVICIINNISLFIDARRNLEVTTSLGTVKGQLKTSTNGNDFIAFEGIPYAKPPIGDLRFKSPQMPDPWDDQPLIANQLYECLQTSIIPEEKHIKGDEDCLYINVYKPSKETTEPLDVIVHIHGGFFMTGSGHSFVHADYMLNQDIIFVTFNYRLGIFGFLSTGDSVVPGNMGLKDQVMALQWVKQNIRYFGGNRKSITLTGYSAGAASVHYHYLSPLSRNLFHRGFSHSGVALAPWALQEQPLKQTKKLAGFLACGSNSASKKMVKCLRKKSGHMIMSTLIAFYNYKGMPIAPFGPVVEVEGDDAFMVEKPYETLRNGDVYDVPWITSTTTNEGSFPVMMLLNDLDNINRKWEALSPYLMEYSNTLPKINWKTAARKIRNYYLKGRAISADNLNDFVQIFTDRLFVHDAERAARMQAKSQKSPVYYLHFNYNHGNLLTGVPHTSDAEFFYGFDHTNSSEVGSNEDMNEICMEILKSFAKTGYPDIKDVDWEPTKSDKLSYLNLTNPDNIKMQTTSELAPHQFWRDLGITEYENYIQTFRKYMDIMF